jgi:nitroreductase
LSGRRHEAHKHPVAADRTTVTGAVLARRSTRAFLERPVERPVVEELLALAAHAPSGGNLQPWRVDVVAGEALARLKARVREPGAEQGLELVIYPSPLPEPYRTRRFASGEALYATLGIAREDKPARLAQFARNFDAFGAPVLLIFSLDRIFDRPQWAHLGMFMQNLMLLAEERGLATCPQEAWAGVHRTLAEFLGHGDEVVIHCGMALGYADPDHPVNSLRTGRAPPADFARFHGL